MLLDNNITIYAIAPKYRQLRNRCMKQGISVSEITRLEVLGYQQLTREDKEDFVDSNKCWNNTRC